MLPWSLCASDHLNPGKIIEFADSIQHMYEYREKSYNIIRGAFLMFYLEGKPAFLNLHKGHPFKQIRDRDY